IHVGDDAHAHGFKFRSPFPVLRKPVEINYLLRVVVTVEPEWTSAEWMRFLRRVTVLRNDRNRDEIRQQSDPRLGQRNHHRERIRSFDALYITVLVGVEKAG